MTENDNKNDDAGVASPSPTPELAPANPLTDKDKQEVADLTAKAKDDIKKSVIDSLDSLKPAEPVVKKEVTLTEQQAIENKVRAEVRAELEAKEKERIAIKEKELSELAVKDLKAKVDELQEKINNPLVGGRQPVSGGNPLDGKPPESFDAYDDKKISEIDRASEKAMWEQRSRS